MNVQLVILTNKVCLSEIEPGDSTVIFIVCTAKMFRRRRESQVDFKYHWKRIKTFVKVWLDLSD